MSPTRDAATGTSLARIAPLRWVSHPYELALSPARESADADGLHAPLDLDALVRRIDMALGADGQLL
jgi:hypothetical protein